MPPFGTLVVADERGEAVDQNTGTGRVAVDDGVVDGMDVIRRESGPELNSAIETLHDFRARCAAHVVQMEEEIRQLKPRFGIIGMLREELAQHADAVRITLFV